MLTFLTIVSPYASPIDATFYLMLAFAIGGPILAYLLLSKRIYAHLKVGSVLGLLIGLVSIVSVGTVILSGYYASQITPVVFADETVSFSKKIIPYHQIRKHYLKPVYQQSRYSAQINTDTALLFVIEEKDKKVHVFSNDYYDLKLLKETSDKYLN